jgi:[ribosomal protein S18]-alanine N-acetyltransferase
MNIQSRVSIRPVGSGDFSALSNFINSGVQVHRHLDWRAPLEWLGTQPFFVAEESRQIEAVMACPADPKEIAWVRLFAASDSVFRYQLWRVLLEASIERLQTQSPMRLAAIALQDWFQRILRDSGFENSHNIVVLEWEGQTPLNLANRNPILIRTMLPEDLVEVQRIDALAFDPLWRNSLDSLELAYQQSTYSTVAENENDGIVGYQISTAAPLSGHLARLAVRPDLQHSHIGYEMVRDLMLYFKKQRAWRVTVNTQSNNQASLTLYQKIGFHRTGEEFPVFEYPHPIGAN